MSQYESIKKELRYHPRRWLITGVAGFIGSNLLESLLKLDQTVVGLDNFVTGKRENLSEVKNTVSEEQWNRFKLIEDDIQSARACYNACIDVQYVLHQAALGSVSRSIENPKDSNDNNITGTLNLMVAAINTNVKRFVYASSSSVYGDHPGLPKIETDIGRPLSPYAVTKYVNELYAEQFAGHYRLESIGLRYFNVFGPRQDPEGPYAAVIPKWISAIIKGKKVFINGTGETSRDFCFIENVVQINLLAATEMNPGSVNQVYNVAVNARTDLNQLFEMLLSRLAMGNESLKNIKPCYRAFRAGDVLHSQADISKAVRLLGYSPTHSIEQGLDESLAWYKKNLG